MQASQSSSSTNSTQGNHLSIKIEEQDSRETWVSISPTPQHAPPLPPPRMMTPRPPTSKTWRRDGKPSWDSPRAPHTESHTSGTKRKRGRRLEGRAMCCRGQHVTKTGARCTSGTRRPQDGSPKTDLGLCHQYQYRTRTKINRGNATDKA